MQIIFMHKLAPIQCNCCFPVQFKEHILFASLWCICEPKCAAPFGTERSCDQRSHDQRGHVIYAQQTTTRDFTSSVSEFMCSTGSIHMNSLDSVNKFSMSTLAFREIQVFHAMTRTSETVPVLT